MTNNSEHRSLCYNIINNRNNIVISRNIISSCISISWSDIANCNDIVISWSNIISSCIIINCSDIVISWGDIAVG